MGLFRRRAETKQELETLRNELRSVSARLDRADAAKVEMADKLGRLDDENQRLVSQVGTVESQVGTVQSQVVTVASSIDDAVGKAASVDAFETLRGDVVRLHGLVGKVDELGASVDRQSAAPSVDPSALADLGNQLETLAVSIVRQQEQIADVALVATDSAERTTETQTALAGLAEQVDHTPAGGIDIELRQQLGQLAEKVSTLDSRINQISVELTNQLTELSSDIENSARGDAPDAAAIVSELEELMNARIESHLNDVTDGQKRLANEQVRYAIQFRQDLADLADRLRRPDSR